MNESLSNANPEASLRWWRRLALVLGLTTVASLLLLAAAYFFATQSLGTHYNLYYLLWKAGIRSYERPIAFGGLFHDDSYRRRFIGMSPEQFEQAFPNTFYRVRRPPPIAKPNQVFYIDDYHQAQREEGGYGMCWVAVFEDGRLIELEVFKS